VAPVGAVAGVRQVGVAEASEQVLDIMAMDGEKIGDVKRGNVQEPTYIVIEIPRAARSKCPVATL
jgi:hypothetical protein